MILLFILPLFFPLSFGVTCPYKFRWPAETHFLSRQYHHLITDLLTEHIALLDKIWEMRCHLIQKKLA